MSNGILVLCPFDLDCGLLSKAVCLAKGEPVRILVPRAQVECAAQYGAEQIHALPDAFECPDEAAFALWLVHKVTQWESSVILAPATVQMRAIMPMLAWHLNAGLTADCTDLSMQDGALIQTRPAFGNSLIADIGTLSAIQMATVRPGMFQTVETPADSFSVTDESPEFSGSVKLNSFIEYLDGIPLAQAGVVVAGGVGIGSAQGFQKLELFARKLGGCVAASRSAVDAGFAPYRCQVGMTGVSVCPKLYIAVGISGAVQHLAGMSGSATVVAINSDPKAPIFDYADYGIVGDWDVVITKLLEGLS